MIDITEQYNSALPGPDTALSVPNIHRDFSDTQGGVLHFTSIGQTVVQIADLMDIKPDEVESVQADLMEMFDAPNMAATLNRAIQQKKLLIEPKPDPERVESLTGRQVETLGFIAVGLSNKQIAQIFGKQHSTFQKNVIRPIFGKIRANDRTHAVPRSYQLGIFKVDN